MKRPIRVVPAVLAALWCACSRQPTPRDEAPVPAAQAPAVTAPVPAPVVIEAPDAGPSEDERLGAAFLAFRKKVKNTPGLGRFVVGVSQDKTSRWMAYASVTTETAMLQSELRRQVAMALEIIWVRAASDAGLTRSVAVSLVSPSGHFVARATPGHAVAEDE